MMLDVLLTPHTLGSAEVSGRTVFVIDVLRATSTIAAALAHGARLVEQHLGLQELELEAHRPELVAEQEIGVAERQAIGRMARLRGIGGRRLGEAGFLLGAVELAGLEVLIVGGRWVCFIHSCLQFVALSYALVRRFESICMIGFPRGS